MLSVIAQQLLVLFGAKAELSSYSESKELEFEGSTINMRPTFNVFITMNPGYAGRTELPDNLQVGNHCGYHSIIPSNRHSSDQWL